MNRGRVYLALGTQVSIAAVSYLVSKAAVDHFSAAEVVLLRAVLSAPLFAVLLVGRPSPRLPAIGEVPLLLLLGLLGVVLNQGLFLTGLRSSTAGHAALMYALTPLLVLLASVGSRAEQARTGRMVGIALALAGVVIVLRDRGMTAGASVLSGDLLIFLGVVAWALYTVLSRRIGPAHGAVRLTSWTMLAGTVLTLPFVAEIDPEHFRTAGLGAWLGIVWLALATSFLSYLLWIYALARAEASQVSVWSNLQPILTAVLAWAVQGAPITAGFAVGGALVLGGVWMTQRR